ncbi:MAG: hypothetical protein Q9221_009004 [Calogaya cf. arnoldii]
MVFIVSRVLLSISLLSLISATNNDNAHQNDNDFAEPSASTSDLPSTVIHAPKPYRLTTSYLPASSSRVAEYPKASSGTNPSEALQQQPSGTGLYPRPRQSYPALYNTSSTPGPTASGSNDFLPQEPTDGSIAGLSLPSDCPPPSTVTIVNTITAPPTTVTAPPITVTVTSRVSGKIESPQKITPTVTITVTTTVCAGSGQNTHVGGNGSSDVTSMGGGGQPGAGFGGEQGGFEPSPPPDSGPKAVVVTPSHVPNSGSGGPYPQGLGSGSVTQPFQPSYSNSTSYEAPAFGATDGGQISDNADEPPSNVEEPPNTTLRLDTGADRPAAASGQPGSGEEAPSPKNNDSITSPDQDYGEASGNVGTQEINTPYQPPAEAASDKGEEPEEIQMLPELSGTQSAEIPIQTGSNPDQPGPGSAVVIGSTTPPYRFNNGKLTGLIWPTNSYELRPNPRITSATERPQIPATNGEENHDVPYQSGPNGVLASQGSGTPSPTRFLPPYQSLPNQTSFSNPSSTTPQNDSPTTTSNITSDNQTSSDTGVVYKTMTQEVVPVPMETATNDSSNQEIDSSKANNNSTPSTNGSVQDVPGDVEDNENGFDLTSAITSDNDSLPADSQPQQVSPESSGTSSLQPLPTTTPTSSAVEGDDLTSPSLAVNDDEPIPSSQPLPLPPTNNMTSPAEKDDAEKDDAEEDNEPIPSSQPQPLPPIDNTTSSTGKDNEHIIPSQPLNPPPVDNSTSPADKGGDPIPPSEPPNLPSDNTNSPADRDDGPVSPSQPPSLSPVNDTPPAVKDDKAVPPSLPPPLPPIDNTTSTKPSCVPTLEDHLITVDFNTLEPSSPLPAPYQYLTYTGFSISAASASSQLGAFASTPMKSISIAPRTNHFDLASISLACSAPPCDITMWGTKVASKTAQGAAAGALLTSKTRVEGLDVYVPVEGLAEKGWMDLEKITFKATGEGGVDVGVGIDDLSYVVSVEVGCEGEDVKEGKVEPEGEGKKSGKGNEKRKRHRRRIGKAYRG